MTPPAAAIQQLARQLLAIEATRSGSGKEPQDRTLRACERFRLPLTKLVGVAGFVSLMSRALALAKGKAPSLAALHVAADGSLEGFVDAPAAVGPPAPEQPDGAVLVAELLGLLVTFVGQPLTLNLVRQSWPEISVESTHPSTKEER